MTNQQFARKDEHFKACCQAVKMEMIIDEKLIKGSLRPTARQASKFQNGKGLAFTQGRLIVKEEARALAMHAQGE